MEIGNSSNEKFGIKQLDILIRQLNTNSCLTLKLIKQHKFYLLF